MRSNKPHSSELITIGFKGEDTANKALLDLLKLEEKHTISLDEAAVTTVNDAGTINIKQRNLLVLTDAALGSLFGVALLGPVGILIGGVIGAAAGTMVKILKHLEISTNIVKNVAEKLEPGSSAIVIRVNTSITKRVLDSLKKYDGKLLPLHYA